jgi:hypothetical protein
MRNRSTCPASHTPVRTPNGAFRRPGNFPLRFGFERLGSLQLDRCDASPDACRPGHGRASTRVAGLPDPAARTDSRRKRVRCAFAACRNSSRLAMGATTSAIFAVS